MEQPMHAPSAAFEAIGSPRGPPKPARCALVRAVSPAASEDLSTEGRASLPPKRAKRVVFKTPRSVLKSMPFSEHAPRFETKGFSKRSPPLRNAGVLKTAVGAPGAAARLAPQRAGAAHATVNSSLFNLVLDWSAVASRRQRRREHEAGARGREHRTEVRSEAAPAGPAREHRKHGNVSL